MSLKVNVIGGVDRGRDWQAFLSSCVAIVALMWLFSLEMYPNLALSKPAPANRLNIKNAAF